MPVVVGRLVRNGHSSLEDHRVAVLEGRGGKYVRAAASLSNGMDLDAPWSDSMEVNFLGSYAGG